METFEVHLSKQAHKISKVIIFGERASIKVSKKVDEVSCFKDARQPIEHVRMPFELITQKEVEAEASEQDGLPNDK